MKSVLPVLNRPSNDHRSWFLLVLSKAIWMCTLVLLGGGVWAEAATGASQVFVREGADRRDGEDPTAFLVPVVIRIQGWNDTFWKSDLRLFNPNQEPVEVMMDYRPADQNNEAGVFGRSFIVGPMETWFVDDVVHTIPDIPEGGGAGSLVFEFRYQSGEIPETLPVIVSRTYNETSEGSYGQFIPAVPLTSLHGRPIYLVGLTDNTSFRSNVGLNNLGAEQAWVQLTVLDETGAEVGQVGRWVLGHSSHMVNRVALAAGLQFADVFTVRVDTFDASVDAYASVIDNMTGDPVFHTGQHMDDAVVFVPGLARIEGVNNTFWRSDIVLFNPMGRELDGRISYIAGEEEVTDRPWMEFADMPSGFIYLFNHVLSFLVGEEMSTKGYLIVATEDGSPVPLISARTYNQEAGSGTFGQNLGVFGARDLVYQGERAYIPGVTSSSNPSSGFRTNLGLVNTDQNDSAEIDITLYAEGGAVVGSISRLLLTPGRFKQFNLFHALGLDHVDMVGSLEIEVVDGGGLAAYVSIIDNRTQDPIFVPAVVP